MNLQTGLTDYSVRDEISPRCCQLGHWAGIMLFCSQQFLFFFLVVFAAYWTMPWPRGRVYLLLAASFVFYATWNEWLAILIVISSTADYFIARGLDRSDRPGLRKLLLTASILFNVGILCYFKYVNFFLRSLEEVLRSSGSAASLPVLSVILPIGISFYTFEAISYTVDVYRRKIRAEKNLAHFMLFILFFPHLIAGPIVRGSDFLPQIRRKKRWNWMRMNVGVQLFMLGMVKKLAIGDRLALLTDPVFADPGAFQAGVLWIAAFAYAIQVYCDFSGYSDMALGTAHLLGYRLVFNFNLPYLASNITEFWRRWHISLSSWLRDYIFYPLGGSRGSRWATSRNLIVVMTLGGLWHGAAWTFVVFGAIQGTWLALHRLFREYASHRPLLDRTLKTPCGTAGRVMLTFVAFSCTLVVFRAESIAKAVTMLGHMLAWNGAGRLPRVNFAAIAFLVGVVMAGHWLACRDRWRKALEAIPATAVGIGYSAAVCAALILAPEAGKAFIYFQF
jgi:alginate O-acetyltransferase complex protein AlgI